MSRRKPSKVEKIKESSRNLRGTVEEELSNDQPNFSKESYQILKFHGTYQQDDRDKRRGRDKHWMYMIRGRVPGGKMSAEQYLAIDNIVEKYGDKSIRITTRQAFQLYGVIKNNLKQTFREINEAMITTMGACGDVVRNVMATPAPDIDGRQEQIQSFANKLSDELLPATRAYHEIWLDGEKVFSGNPLNQINGQQSEEKQPDSSQLPTAGQTENGRQTDVEQPPHGHSLRSHTGGDSESATSDRSEQAEGESGKGTEPLYGDTYLPRKFKIGITLPRDNSIDLYTQDIGLVALFDEDNQIEGFNVIVGGGLGMQHKKPDTYPRLGDHLGYTPAENVEEVVKGIIKVQRDLGNRENRKRARMKYLIDEIGLDTFHNELTKRTGFELEPFREMPDFEPELYLGWNRQSDGRWFLGVSVENGRIKDEGDLLLRSAFRKIAETIRPGFRLTPNQNILLTDIEESDKEAVDALLAEHGVKPDHELSSLLKNSMACPALPTCGLAIAESERVFPDVIRNLEAVLTELGLQDEVISVRMTGCPNGCARPYVADIGLVGRSLDKYTIFLGGSPAGTRLGKVYKDLVSYEELIDEIRPLFEHFRENRRQDEPFSDFWNRTGIEEARALTVTP